MNWEPGLIWSLNSDKTRTLNNQSSMKRRKSLSQKALQALNCTELGSKIQNPASATQRENAG